MNELPLEEQLLNLSPDSAEAVSGIQPKRIIDAIRENWGSDLRDIIGSTSLQSINLDQAQAESLLTGLMKRVSLIQGPPGESQSFCVS
jgi:hypothetical protein